MILGLLAERQFGRVRLFINGENSRACGRRNGIRFFVRHARRTVDGRSMRGHLEGRNINEDAAALLDGRQSQETGDRRQNTD